MVPFKDLVENPRVWQETAHDLICAANILFEAVQDTDHHRSGTRDRRPIVWCSLMMLYGLAAENLTKAIIVAKVARRETRASPGLVDRSEGPLPNWFTTHNLVELARDRAGLTLSRSQKHLLKRLQEFVECGKYPVGVREGQGRSTWVSLEPFDSNDTLQLLEYLENELQRASNGFVVQASDLRGIHREGT